MKYADVGPVRVPLLGMGTMHLHGQLCVQVVRTGLSLGYRLLDTAGVC